MKSSCRKGCVKVVFPAESLAFAKKPLAKYSRFFPTKYKTSDKLVYMINTKVDILWSSICFSTPTPNSFNYCGQW